MNAGGYGLFPMLITAALAWLMDYATKQLAGLYLSTETVEVVPHFLVLSVTRNHGIAFGMLAGKDIALMVLPLAVILCGWLVLRKYRRTTFVNIAVGLVLGGFLGNYVQRIVSGYVLDMLYFPFLPWFVCNVADVLICLGIGLLMFSLLFRPQDWREKDAKDGSDQPV